MLEWIPSLEYPSLLLFYRAEFQEYPIKYLGKNIFK